MDLIRKARRRARGEFTEMKADVAARSLSAKKARAERRRQRERLMVEKEKIRAETELREFRRSESQRAIKKSGSRLSGALGGLRRNEASTSPFSPRNAAPSGSDKTRAVLGGDGGGDKARSILMGSGRNPFYDEPKKEKKKKDVIIRIQQ